MKSPILGAAYVARSTNAADNRLINLYPESTPDGGKTAAYFQRVPGIRQVISFIPSQTATVRGLWVARDILYAVIGSSLYAYNFQYNSAGQFVSSTSTLISTNISGTGPVSMVDNGSQIFIATNPDGYIYNINTTVFAKIGDPDFPGAVTVGYINGYFVFNEPNSQRVWVTSLLDGTSIDPLEFASAEGSPDDLVGFEVDHRQAVLLGEESGELYENTGVAGFPFERAINGFFEVGCFNGDTVVKLDNSVVWVANDYTVRRLQGVNDKSRCICRPGDNINAFAL